MSADPPIVLFHPNCFAPPPKLTNAEKQAIEAAVRIIDANEEEMDGFSSGAARTLRELLARCDKSTVHYID